MKLSLALLLTMTACTTYQGYVVEPPPPPPVHVGFDQHSDVDKPTRGPDEPAMCGPERAEVIRQNERVAEMHRLREQWESEHCTRTMHRKVYVGLVSGEEVASAYDGTWMLCDGKPAQGVTNDQLYRLSIERGRHVNYVIRCCGHRLGIGERC